MANLIKCNACKELKLDQYDFPFRWTSQHGKYYYEHTCRKCKAIIKRNYYQKHKKQMRKQKALYRAKNIDHIRALYRKAYPKYAEHQKRYRNSRKEHYRKLFKNHYENNKKYYLNRNVDRRILESYQTPIDLPDDEKIRIDNLYKKCRTLNSYFSKTMFEVDHILPISKGGLHHPDNLQIITKEDNRCKGVQLNYKLKFRFKITM